jgi:ankyrin repeat protein
VLSHSRPWAQCPWVSFVTICQMGQPPILRMCLHSVYHWLLCSYGSLECVKVLTTHGANVSHRDEDGMSVLEHAEQNDRRQVVALIKRAQLANQMRQRRKQKNHHKESGLSTDEYEKKEQEAKARMAEFLQVCLPSWSAAGGVGS